MNLKTAVIAMFMFAAPIGIVAAMNFKSIQNLFEIDKHRGKVMYFQKGSR